MKPKERNDKKIMTLNYRIIHVMWILLMLCPVLLTAQVTFSRIPMDKQLVARDPATNIGQVIVSGQVEYSGADPDYVKMRIEILREGSSYVIEDTPVLQYNNKKADFDFSVGIEAEFANYSIIISGIDSNNNAGPSLDLPTGTGKEIVAGDVFVIQGQSNAEALKRDPPDQSANGNQSQWIRTFGTMQRANNFLDNLRWEQAQGDGPDYTFTVGQWGLKLAKLLIDDPAVSVPIAVFNGAQGNTRISQHLKDADPILSNWDYNIYERLFIRLDSTHLRDKVRAILWSQGENDGVLGTTTQGYINLFDELKNSWLQDYINVKRIYIFQSKSGCDQNLIGVKEIEHIKEAQRLIAFNDDKIHLMQTALPLTSSGAADYGCHFTFTNGYEEFANRIFKLIDRDFYGGTYSKDIEPPMPLKAYLIGTGALEIQTDALSLSITDQPAELTDFIFNGGSVFASDISTIGNKIVIKFTGSLSSGTTLSYIGLGSGENKTNFVVNSEGLELACFDQLPIDTSLLSIWNGSNWNPTTPSESMDARIDDSYDASNGSIITRDLEVVGGVNVDFDNNSNNSIIVYGDLNLNGSLIIGDTESLLIKNTGATITGGSNFTKIEKTTPLQSYYDVTYFSSPVSGANLETVFDEVDANRIFEYIPSVENQDYMGIYNDIYRHWFIASGSMEIGKGYAVDGDLLGPYPDHQMEARFNGAPNYMDVTLNIGHGRNPSDVDDVDRVNLLGNPYPTAIDAQLVIDENFGNFQGALYLWGHQINYINGEYDVADYFTFNLAGASSSVIPTGYKIASGQGFMIMTDKPNTSFKFNNSMMVEGENTDFYKTQSPKNDAITQEDRLWLQFSDDKKIKKEILIGLSAEASDKYDKGFDSRLYSSDPRMSFYSMLPDKKSFYNKKERSSRPKRNTERLSIQSIALPQFGKRIPLGFFVLESGSYYLGISKTQGKFDGMSIMLNDQLLNVQHDLKNMDYIFDSLNGEFNDRFELILRKEDYDAENEEKVSLLNIINIENGLRIESDKIITHYDVYDLLGRTIYSMNSNDSSIELNLSKIKKGTIIIIHTIFNDNSEAKKKTILM